MLKIKFIVMSLSIFTLLGCGGGEGDYGDFYIPEPDYYGAVAINPQTKAGGITARYAKQSEADFEASKLCGFINCNIVLRFDTGLCAAVSRGSNMALGWASDRSNSDARQKATNQCQINGGTDCQILLNECNK
jgi:hypothetical protein